MSKVSELDRILQEMKKCGESLACIAEELAEGFSGSGGAEEQKEAGGKPGKKGFCHRADLCACGQGQDRHSRDRAEGI